MPKKHRLLNPCGFVGVSCTDIITQREKIIRKPDLMLMSFPLRPQQGAPIGRDVVTV
jgi:hypothetical protein